jgi:hypothetical protein
MFDSFDIIVYHDCEPAGVVWYEYTFSELLYQKYDNFILTCPTAWTGCFIKKSLNAEHNLRNTIASHINKYCENIGIDQGLMILR